MKKIVLIFNGQQFNITGEITKMLRAKSNLVSFISFPLSRLDTPYRYTVDYKDEIKKTKIRILPPFSFFFDLLYPLRIREFEIAISFNPLISTKLIFLKKILRLKTTIIHWNIDFTPRRFPFPFNIVYDAFDKFSYKYSNYQVDISQRAQTARFTKYRMKEFDKNKHYVINVGLHVSELKPLPISNFHLKKVVFLGNPITSQGVWEIVECAKILSEENSDVNFHFVGGGGELESIKRKVKELKLKNIEFYGELDRKNYLHVLRSCSLGLAPYLVSQKNFSYYADPSKIKDYMQANLPILGTEMSEITHILIKEKAMFKVENLTFDIKKVFDNLDDWIESRDNLLIQAKKFDWNKSLETISKLTIETIS
jgi:glycosyltransferase involved in cell wall biosynthesis